jgi:hypothetical protein
MRSVLLFAVGWVAIPALALTAQDTTTTEPPVPADTSASRWLPLFERPPEVAADTSRPREPVPSSPLWLISDNALDRARLEEIEGRVTLPRLLLRSPGVLLWQGEQPLSGTRVLGPEVQYVHNSALPWSHNDGALWAGVGANFRVAGGFTAQQGRLRLVIAPELIISENRHFDLRVPWIERPPIPEDRSEWQFEWYAYGPYSVDMPTRFGDGRLRRLSPGQSSVALTLGKLQLGAGTENNWWGPGIQNALILSNNAPGFPHLFLRSARPLQTRWGALDFRWLTGGLSESDFFDTLSTNDLRSIAAAALTYEFRRPQGLTVGFARTVWGTATGWGEVPGRWFEVFRLVRRPNNVPLSDSTLHPGGREHLYSFFGRWVFPRAGVETYFEWGRTEFPASVRDMFVSPGHTQAYTLGLQWIRQGFGSADLLRIQAENTTVEQSASFADRRLGVWYTSRRVIQGYTNRGQPLGAAVGPGSSGQSITVDYLWPTRSLGVRLGRMRVNEDVRSISAIPDFKSWCTHDIVLYGSLRASARSRFGLMELDFTPANRIQAWFQVGSGCPRGDAMVDIRNQTLRLTLSR